MRRIAKAGIAGALSLILVVLTVLSLLAYAVVSTVLEPYSWNEYIKDSGAYPELAEFLSGQLDLPEASEASYEQQQLRQTTALALERIVTPEWVESKIVHLQTSFWDYMLGKEDRLRNVPIPELREALTVVLEDMIEQGNATAEEKQRWSAQLNEQVPSEIDLYNVYNIKEENLQLVKRRLEQVSEGISLLFALLAVLVLLGGLVAFYPVWLLRWIGYTAAGSGIIAGTLYWGTQRLDPERQMERLWSDRLNDWSDVVGRLAMSLLNEALSVVLIGVAGAAAVGLLAVAASHLPAARRGNGAVRRFAKQHKAVVLAGRVGGMLLLMGAMTAAIWSFAAEWTVR